VALVALLIPVGSASAEWHDTKHGAHVTARDAASQL
jgi:hypothetical protein